ncbi:ribosome-inactivating family protein [Microbulbifer sp. SSSA005]|uniref:ribosome-inactivating family protein n=1 Tax=Microbulbifer sp. SSSA005 TaxID=3243378 RepID=UPI004039BE12
MKHMTVRVDAINYFNDLKELREEVTRRRKDILKAKAEAAAEAEAQAKVGHSAGVQAKVVLSDPKDFLVVQLEMNCDGAGKRKVNFYLDPYDLYLGGFSCKDQGGNAYYLNYIKSGIFADKSYVSLRMDGTYDDCGIVKQPPKGLYHPDNLIGLSSFHSSVVSLSLVENKFDAGKNDEIYRAFGKAIILISESIRFHSISEFCNEIIVNNAYGSQIDYETFLDVVQNWENSTKVGSADVAIPWMWRLEKSEDLKIILQHLESFERR